MGILLETVRIFGFRGLGNIEVMLDQITVLTGMNNSGKTSFLKALQIAFGNRHFISQDDFYYSGKTFMRNIIVDIKIIPTDSPENSPKIFSEDWEILFKEDRIKTDTDGNSFVPFRTVVSFDLLRNIFKTTQYILQDWPKFKSDAGEFWYSSANGHEKGFFCEEMPFFYMDAQRDILEDMKGKNSYLGRMISKIEYSDEDVKKIETQINELNEQAVSSSEILLNIKSVLKDLDSAMDTSSEGVEITPFTKKLRDINKGMSIYYSDKKDSFSMEYHGMGTRSWSSLLTLKSFIQLLSINATKENSPFFPILAIEEPEAHLHPNAQKRLFSQISGIAGQKIVSTHSPYIAASAEIHQIRSFYTENGNVVTGKIERDTFDKEGLRRIKRQVIDTRGEIFFSKLLIFFEGETEEQALPILAENFFKMTSNDMGIDFVGVRGYGNYLAFLRFAESLNIPWFLFSDAEPIIKASVKQQFTECNARRPEIDSIIFLDDGCCFEQQLLNDGFSFEIIQAILKVQLPKCMSEQHVAAKKLEIENHDNVKLLEILKGSKTLYASGAAEAIIESGKQFPPKVLDLFSKVKNFLKIENL